MPSLSCSRAANASTEPATDIGPEPSKLWARGHANNGPATSWFEYWVTGRAGPPLKTRSLHWPAGANGGPFAQAVDKLSAGTGYSFRICGSDQGTPPEGVCAQTRTFTTSAATQDVAHGSWWSGCCVSFGVNARSGPSGQNPHGTMNRREGSSWSQTWWSFQGSVTCLEVNRRRAVIGAVGERIDDPGGTTSPARMLALVEDGVTGSDRFAVTDASTGSTPPDCKTAEFGSPTQSPQQFEWVVNDAQP